MFSAIKKLTSKQDAPTSAGPPNTAGIPMSGSLQKKFAKGVQYNSKLSFECTYRVNNFEQTKRFADKVIVDSSET